MNLSKGKDKIDPNSANDPSPTMGEIFGGTSWDDLPEGATEDENVSAKISDEYSEVSFNVPLRLAIERKGHAGKTVTLLFGVKGSDAAVRTFLKDLKKSLGCGASKAEESFVFQGDQREKLAVLLKSRGAKKVVGI